MSIVINNSYQKLVTALKSGILFRPYNFTDARDITGAISHACDLLLRIKIINKGYRETLNSGIFANASLHDRSIL